MEAPPAATIETTNARRRHMPETQCVQEAATANPGRGKVRGQDP